MKPSKIIALVVIALLLAAAFYFDLFHYLTLENLKANREKLTDLYTGNRALFIAAFFTLYVVATSLSLPGAAILTLAGGFIFGSALGSLIVIFAATIGALCAFLVARFIFRSPLEKKYTATIEKFDAGLNQNAWSYLLFLRLVPAFPFFLVNIVLGLTRLSPSVFFFGSLIGMYPGTLVYAYAGSQLSQISNLSDIASPGILFAFTLLGLFALVPTIIKKIKQKRN